MRKPRLLTRLAPLGVLLLFAAATAFGASLLAFSPQDEGRAGRSVARRAPQEGPDMADAPDWKEEEWQEVRRLIAEQKMSAAEEKVEELLTAAREEGRTEDWTRALIRRTQLTMALHAYETAVEELAAARDGADGGWPEDPEHRSILHLFYGESLRAYLQAYSWEIQQRERVAGDEVVDLKAWTKEQIAAAAQASYLEVWKRRESWGERSIGAWAEYIEPNNYPAHIRGTLRDAVTYQWADLLGDTGLWQPEQSQEVYRLSLDELLSDAGPALGDEALASPEEHPLRKLAAVLADLETWHRESDRPEAAFEARRVRDERLHEAFSQEEDRARIRDDLARALDRLSPRYEWWSMGRATLARMVEQKDAPDALVEALALAREGEEEHPQSIGGKHCRQIAASIESFAFEITSMASDGTDRRSLAVDHKNLEALHFRAYRLDLMERLRSAEDYNLLPGYQDVPKLLAGREPDESWTVELPATPDYRQHRTFVTPPLDDPGLYLIVASKDADFRSEPTAATALNLIVTDLVILSRVDDATAEVTVRSGESGDPVSGVEVSLFRYDWQKGHREVASGATGADGIVRFQGELQKNGSYFAVARRGDDTALYADRLNRRYDREDPNQQASLLFTDRSVYRPGQDVAWKVITYEGKSSEGDYRVTSGTSVTVTLTDANGEVVAQEAVKTNDHGSASGSFSIPRGRLLGGWHLQSSMGAGTLLRVEEYKRPTFEVTVDDPQEALRLNRPATLQGSVRYYFGLPVTHGSVRWRVTREPVYPDWWAWWGRPTQGSRVIDSGTAELGEDGTFRVTFTPEADEREAASAGAGARTGRGRRILPRPPGPGVSYRYRLAVEVTDEGGETREADRTFRLGFTAVSATIEQTRGFLQAEKAQEIRIRRTDLDGSPQPGEGSWRLVRLVEPAETPLPADLPARGEMPAPVEGGAEGDTSAAAWTGEEPYETAGDRQRPRWFTSFETDEILRLWESGAEAASGRLEHGADGWATAVLPPVEAGAYALLYETEDAFGSRLSIRESFLVSRDGAEAPHLPAVLEVDHDSVQVGETVRLLAASGLPDQEMRLEIYRNGQEPEVRTFRSGEGARVLEIPITARDRGGISFRMTALRDYQLMMPHVRITVPWTDRRLDVELATFRDRLRPGDRETWTVKVKSASSPGEDPTAVAAGAAELLAYMYDRSLDLFAPHNPIDPLVLYPERWPAEPLGSSLGAAGPVWRSRNGWPSVPSAPALTPDRLKFFDGYGIGGPGRRMRGGMALRSLGYLSDQAQPEMAMAAPPPPAPAMAMEADAAMNKVASSAVTVTSGSPQLEESLESGADGQGAPPPQVRENFAETAFWEPHLLTGADGSVSFEFTVPDSVTEWNVWVHALTRDLRYGRATEKVATVKELLVRPYLPRFLREGDRAELRVVVNNSGEAPLSGELTFELFDPATDESLAAEFGLGGDAAAPRPFTVEPGGGETLTFPLTVPPRVGTVAIRAVGRAEGEGGALSDGELRPLPVLPGRYHLAQSRFAALHNKDFRELTFDDLAAQADPARRDDSLLTDQLVVTIDGQLFYGVLDALPYLVEYPYECTEQTLNRFLSTGIVTSVFDRYPEVAKMAEQLSERETVVEAWDEPDPNRQMLLVETPWVTAAAGGKAPEGTEILNVLDPARAAQVRRKSLTELQRAQTSLGGFPWWPGGPPSPYMTLYIVHGFSRALEHDVEVPQDVVVRAWDYLHRHYVDELAGRMVKNETGWELITFLNYVLSSYPPESGGGESWTGGVFTAAEREAMLDFSFRHWKEHSPLLKGYLALTLHRAGREDDARLVFDSIMDSAKTDPDLGTYWAPEDRAWLWYNDTIESHAFTLRAMTELAPDDARRKGLVQWLFLNKKLNHWKSTRATAEVIYALVHYLEDEGSLGATEHIQVRVGPKRETFTFEPDRYTGKKNQLVVPGEELDPATQSTVAVHKETPGFAFASATWHFSTETLPPEARGDFFSVERSFFRRELQGDEWVLTPLTEGEEIAVGDEVEVRLSIRSKHAAEYVHLRSPRGAGFEPVELTSGYRWDLGIGWYQETRDSGSSFFFDGLPAGEYTLKVRWRAAMAGAFKVGPATLQSMYAPEFNAYSSGALLTVEAEVADEP